MFFCVAVGVALGYLIPGVFQIVGTAEIAKVNIPIAILIWLMIINWAIKPFSMA